MHANLTSKLLRNKPGLAERVEQLNKQQAGRQAGRQAGKQASKQASKQAKQASKQQQQQQTSKQPDTLEPNKYRHLTHRRTNKRQNTVRSHHTNKQTNTPAYMQTEQTDITSKRVA